MGEERGSSRIDGKWRDLSAKISEVVEKLLEEKGVTKSQLSSDIGYSQSAISDTFNPAKANRRWSFPLLMLVGDYLRVPVYKIIEAAERGGKAAWLELYLAKTPPNSMDRLELLVRTCATEEEAKDKKLLTLYYSALMFEQYAPELAAVYLNGEADDREIYEFLHEALAGLSDGDHLWNGVKTLYETWRNRRK